MHTSTLRATQSLSVECMLLAMGRVQNGNSWFFGHGTGSNPAPGIGGSDSALEASTCWCSARRGRKGGLALFSFLALAMSVSLGAGTSRPRYDIASNVQVSVSQPKLRHYETYVGADPRNEKRFISCALVVLPNNEIDNVFYVSSDSGKSWSHALTVKSAVDPSCEIGPDGVMYAANIHDQPFPDGKTDSVLSVYWSRDGGRTWKASSVQIATRGIDRAYLTVDDSPSRFRGFVYVDAYVASHTPPAASFLFYRSMDHGRSFKTVLAKKSAFFSEPWFFPANGVVGADGNYFTLAAELDNTKKKFGSAPASADAVLCIYRSLDGGRTLELAGTIPDIYYDWRVPQLSMSGLAIDSSSGPLRGRLYAVWPDARYNHQTQILMSFSRDKGKTWSSPKVIGNDSTNHDPNKQPNNYMPAIAVNRDGVVGISWYDRRDNPDNIGYYERFVASLDGGATWLPSVRVSTSPNLASTKDIRGETGGLTADAKGEFHPVWIDNRTGIPQMWTAAVKVLGRVP